MPVVRPASLRMLAVPRTPDTPHPTPPERSAPVARLLCGEPLHDVDLSGAEDAAEARIRIAAALGIHAEFVQLVDLATHAILSDSAPLGGDVQVVRLASDPVVEQDAEQAFVSAAAVTSMAQLSDRENLIRVRQSGLSALPDSLKYLTSLLSLDLRANQLMYLPETIGELVSLRILDLTKNRLKALPASFGQLQALGFLHLHANQLASLPESFGQLARLQNLHLSRNQLTRLPESFGRLLELRKLYLRGNRLRRLPDPLSQLLMLEVLDL